MASLQRQAISSIKWTSLQTVVSGLTGPVLLIVKSRFLTPDDFAHVAIILIFIGLFRIFEDFGISQAIIQRDKITVKESSSLFFFNLIVCGLAALILYLASPLIAVFFSMPDLRSYLRLATVILLITGPSLLFRAFLEKHLYFKHLSLIEMARNVITLLATTLLLFLGMGVWAVLGGQIISVVFVTFAIAIIALYYRTFTMAIYFNLFALVPFLRFGMFVSAKKMLAQLAHRLDEIVIGYFLEPDVLGIYFFGKSMLSKLRGLMTRSFGKVLFPVFSKLKHKRGSLTAAYLRVTRFIALAAFPVFGGTAVTAHLFVPVVFGEQWIESVIVFQVFSLSMIFLLLTSSISLSLLYSVNKPDIAFYVDILTNVVYFISLLLFVSYGMIAVLVTYSFYIVYKTMALQFFANKELEGGLGAYLNELKVPAFSSLIMVGAILSLELFVGLNLSDIVMLIFSILIGAAIYISLILILAPETCRGLKKVVLKGHI